MKFVEENYPLPEEPEPLPGMVIFEVNFVLTSLYCESSGIHFLQTAGEESVKELPKKRHSATPDVSLKGRVRKVAKWRPASDDESDEEIECEFLETSMSLWFAS